MTDLERGHARVLCAAGHRHRRYVRWSEVEPSARLPEQLWRWRWLLDDRCAIAVPSLPAGQEGLFQPCGERPAPGTDRCMGHARAEQRIKGNRSGLFCKAPLPAPDAATDVSGGSE
jgi:hypothetical protein